MERQRGSYNDSYEWDESISGFVRNNRQDGSVRPPQGAPPQGSNQAVPVPVPHGASSQGHIQQLNPYHSSYQYPPPPPSNPSPSSYGQLNQRKSQSSPSTPMQSANQGQHRRNNSPSHNRSNYNSNGGQFNTRFAGGTPSPPRGNSSSSSSSSSSSPSSSLYSLLGVGRRKP